MTAPLEFPLPDRISVSDDPALLRFLRDHADAPVDVTATHLRRIDTPLLQLLLAAAADRRARNVPFRLTGLRPDQAAQLSALGVSDALLTQDLLNLQGAE